MDATCNFCHNTPYMQEQCFILDNRNPMNKETGKLMGGATVYVCKECLLKSSVKGERKMLVFLIAGVIFFLFALWALSFQKYSRYTPEKYIIWYWAGTVIMLPGFIGGLIACIKRIQNKEQYIHNLLPGEIPGLMNQLKKMPKSQLMLKM